MGVTITATNSEYKFDMGYGGFLNLRSNIALALDKEFGENYKNLRLCVIWTKADNEEHIRKANLIIDKNGLEKEYSDVIDFLYASDGGGNISHRTCKKIYDLIKDIDFGDEIFRYSARAHNDYEEFKLFLRECFSHRRKMRWE